MFAHVDTDLVHEPTVDGWGTKSEKALVFGSVRVVMQSPEDCDAVIRAATEAKRQMLAAAEEGEQP